MDASLAPTSPARRGSAARTLVFVLLGLSLLAGGLWWILGGSAAQPAAVGPGLATPAQADPAAAVVAVPEGERTASESMRALRSSEGLAVQVGVRLAGTGRLTGTVLERGSGAGVSGAKVELHVLPPSGVKWFKTFLRLGTFTEEAGRFEAVAVAMTSGDGSFAFENVRAGSYFVEARGSYHVPEGPVLARVAPSGEGGPVEAWVRKGGRVIGRVERPDGTPAARAGVSLRPGPEEILDRARSGDLVLLDEVADENGAFVIHGVPEGAGWALAAYGDGFALSHARNLSVRAGADTEVTIRARQGATLEGRLVSGGGSEDGPAAGEPIGGGHVGVVPRGLRDLVFVERLLAQCHGTSRADGSFVLHNVPPGDLDLVGWSEGFLPAVGPTLLLEDGGTHGAPDFALETGPTISGRVVDSAGEPVAGARVRWLPVDFKGFEFGFSFAPFLTQAVEGFVFPLTDADGRFTAGPFPGEPPWEVTVTKVGYAENNEEFNPAEDEEPWEIVLVRGGAVEGIVMDGVKREPITGFTVSSDAQLSLRLDAPSGDNPFSGGTLFEDPSGRFRFEPVEPGKRKLTVLAPGYAATRTEELEIVEGETVRGVIVTMNPGASVRGVVLDADGGPLAGALVFWSEDQDWERPEDLPSSRSRRPLAGQMPAGMREYAAGLGVLGEVTTTSRPDGSFQLDGVTPGGVVVYATHRDLAPAQSERLMVEAGETLGGVTLQLAGGATLYGRVSDRFERPVEGVFVVAVAPASMDDDANGAGAGFYEGYTNEAGQYRIERMAPGGYFLTTARGDEALDPMSILGSLNFELVTVPEGKEVEYDIVDTSVGGARVSGRVSYRGEPLQGGNLMAMGFESESLLGVDMKLARIREDGTFLFEGLAPGEYNFQIGGGPGGRRRGDAEAKMLVDVPDLPEVHLELSLPEGEIAGLVLDAESGAPVERAQVRLLASDAPQPSGLLGSVIAQGGGMSENDWTDEDGSFEFPRMQAGEYRLEVSSPRWGELQGLYAPLEPVTIELGENEVLDDLVFRLQPAVILKGTVVDENGTPVPRARVVGLRTDIQTGAMSRTRSDEDGSYELKGLAAGTWDLSVSAEGHAAGSHAGLVIAEDAAPADLELVLPRGVEVSVRVSDASGQPVAGAAAQLIALEGSKATRAGDAEQIFGKFFSGEGTTGADGRYVLGRYAPGRYRLEVQRGAKRSAPREVTLEGDGSALYDVRLP